jgi:phosphoribosyl 1,2-cyclic phosphodiesterase
VDAGLSGKQTQQRLAELGLSLEKIQAVCVTHEHSDHTMGLGVLQRRFGVSLYANAGTIEGLGSNKRFGELSWRVFTTGSRFEIGDLYVEPFSVPHDAYEPVGFIIGHEGARVGVVTDMGMATNLIRERLRSCQAIVIESNHDEQLLTDAARPWSLKQRIRGRQGHLSNRHAAEVMADIASPELQQVFLAHLSRDCNTARLALETAQSGLKEAGHDHIRVCCGYADRISEKWEYQVLVGV